MNSIPTSTIMTPLKHKAGFHHAAHLRVVSAVRSKAISRSRICQRDKGELRASEKALFLIGGRDRERTRPASGSIQKIDRAILGVATAGDVRNPDGKEQVFGQMVAGKQRLTLGGCGARNTDFQVGRHTRVLEIRLNDPLAQGVRIDQVVNLAVVLKERRYHAGIPGPAKVSTRNNLKAVRRIDGVCGRASQPVKTIRVKAIVPRQGTAESTLTVIELHSTADIVFLVPNETAFNIHILESERTFSAQRSGQLTKLKRKISFRGELYIDDGDGPKIISDYRGSRQERKP